MVGIAALLLMACGGGGGDVSKYVSAEGITILRKGDAPSDRSFLRLRDDDGFSICILSGHPPDSRLFYTGSMEVTRDGKLGPGTDKFKPAQLATSKSPGKRLVISLFSIGKDGLLVVTDESGASYKITLPVSVNARGAIEEVGTGSPR